jgi:hypothetical protein
MMNIRLVWAGTVALAMVLGCTEGLAKGTATAPVADYNSAQVAAANGVVTVPFGGILAKPVYTVSAGTLAQINSNFTITLPSGFTFVNIPTLTGPGGATFSPVSGGATSNFCEYKIGGVNIAAGQTISVGSFEVAGATALESQFGGNVLPMTFQSTNNGIASNNDTAPLSVPVFQSAVGSLPDTISPGSGFINTGSTPPATQFVPNGATIATSAQVATFAINTELQDPFNANAPVLSPNGTANSLNPADTANITVDGDFHGIGAAYADPTVTTCASTVPAGSFTGPITASSLTFNAVPINTPVQICMIPDGVNQIDASTNPFVYTYSAGNGVTDYFGGLSQTTANNFYSYAGPPIPQVAFSPSAIPPDGTTQSSMTVTILNPAHNSVALTGVAFSNTLPTGLKLANVVSDGCGGGGSFTATGFTKSGIVLALGASCVEQVNVIAPLGTAVGTYVDTTSYVTSNQEFGGPESGTLTVTTDPIFTLSVAETGTGSGTVTSSPSGINCSTTSNQCASGFASGTSVTLSAAPAPFSSTFTGWSGAGCSGTGTCVVPINQAQNVTANFDQVTYPLNIIESGTGAGQVTSSPAGIACSLTSTQCSATYVGGTAVTLTASAAAGSSFAGWSGGGCTGTAPCTVTMSTAQVVTAAFTQIPSFMLSVVSSGAGSGTVTSMPSGINCGAICNASYQTGTQVKLTAAAASGSTFAGWSGGGCSGIAACTVTITGGTAVAASFVPDTASNLTLVAAVLPDSRSVQVGATPTAFATMINAGPADASTCTIAPAISIPASFVFQTTDPTTNALTGTANTPVNIASGAAQSFVIAFTPTAAFAPTDVALTFSCANAPSPAASTVGVDTLNLSASVSPVPDVVALAASGDPGYVDIPGATGTGVFAVATVNLGVDATITASANIGTANLPVTLTVCQTDPASGACVATPAPSATTDIPANATPTFGIFATGGGSIADMPGVNRVFVTFTDSSGTPARRNLSRGQDAVTAVFVAPRKLALGATSPSGYAWAKDRFRRR